jgi:hypothetical protein
MGMTRSSSKPLAQVIDDRLMRAMREGHEVLPDDLGLLRSYLRLIESLMAEKAMELEPTWALACAAAAEIETLQALELGVAERAVNVQAVTTAQLRLKLEIWLSVTAAMEESQGTSVAERLIASISADLAQINQTRT